MLSIPEARLTNIRANINAKIVSQIMPGLDPTSGLAIQKSQYFLERLLTRYAPRDVAVRFWDGNTWKLPDAYLFFERTRHQLDAVSRSWPAGVRKTIGDLDLTYYLPCTVRGRTIAYMGISRTTDGEYLSSVDLELLVTLAGYVGIAIENASLYRSLQMKV